MTRYFAPKYLVPKYLVLCLLFAAMTSASVRAGPVLDSRRSSPADASPDQAQSCESVSFSRGLRYSQSDQSVLDVATGASRGPASRPVLLFVDGENFAREN